MALEQPTLDDLTWSQMVASIRRRIPAASDGRWTLHAPVDPGVTLLELYAYLLEQRVFWLDQTPDALVHAALSLMGERARTSRAAATVLRLQPADYDLLPSRTPVALARSAPPLVFTTGKATLLLPVRQTGDARREEYEVGLEAGGRDRTLDLRQRRRVCLLPADKSAAEFRVVLWLDKPPAPAAAGKKFSLLFELEVPAGVAPAWSPDAVRGVAPPAALTWWYRRAGSGEWARFEAVEDGTSGLRRSGVVRLRMPSDWTKETGLPPGPSGAEPYAVRVRTESGTYAAPPVVKQIVPNVVVALNQRRTQTHELREEWLPLPGGSVALQDLTTEPEAGAAPLTDHPALEGSVKLSLRERDGRWHVWKRTNALTFSGPEDRVFVVDRELGAVTFGDGLTGRLPVPDTKAAGANLRVKYRVGGGAAGNLDRGLVFEGLAGHAGLPARSVVEAAGGSGPETVEEARARASASLRRVERAVTAEDHVELAVSTPGVAISRAHAELGRHPCHPCKRVPGAVTVYVVPHAPRTDDGVKDCAYVAAPAPDPGALAAVRARMTNARLVAGEVFVLPAVYRRVRLSVELLGDPVDADALRERVEARLRRFLDPLVGGAARTGWEFGEPVRPSALMREAQRAAGEDASVSWVSIGLDGAAPTEDCSDVAIRSHELVVLMEVSVRLRRTATGATGGLR